MTGSERANGVEAKVANGGEARRANLFHPPGRMDLSRPHRPARLTPAVGRGTLSAVARLMGGL